jgi:hypothetical protein
MIKNNNGKAVIEFGTGDICVNSGCWDNVGYVFLNNQEPREIGSPGKIKAGQKIIIDDMDIVIKFTDSRSIDVVINDLNYIKEQMEG